MATLSLTLFKKKALKDGKHKIRIAIRHNHVTCYIVTRFTIEENQFKNGQVVKRPDAAIINRKLRKILDDYQDVIDDIKNIKSYTCQQLKAVLVNGAKEDIATFQSESHLYVNELKEEARNNYATLLERNCRYFTEYAGDIPLSAITSSVIDGYDRFLRMKKKVGDTTVAMMMSRTKTIINRGVKRGAVEYKLHPFVNYKIRSSKVRDVALSVETLNKIRNSDAKEKKLVVARDVFMLSFYLGGINLIDLLQIRFLGDNIKYSRTKCKNTTLGDNEISIAIPEAAKPIIKKWKNRNTDKLDFGYKLSYPNFSRYLSRSLNKLAERENITEKVVYYSARKSFAQYAADIGIPDGVIDYCLGHSDKKRGVLRYYVKVRERQANAAIARVIDYLCNPDKYKDYIAMRSSMML